MNAEIIVSSAAGAPGPLGTLLGTLGLLVGGLLDSLLGALGGLNL